MLLLEVADLHVKYGNIEVLHGIDLKIHEGEIVAILGANGAGKSTTLMTISGLLKPSSGSIRFRNTMLHKMQGHDVVRQGIAQVPEGRRMFGTLTVQENMNLGAFTCNDPMRIRKTQEWIYTLFPILAERRNQLAGTLSGGEQQMLAISRGLMADPKVLLLDEPSMGLAPVLVDQIFDTIGRLHASGKTILLVEQNARKALQIANRGYVIETGRIVLSADAATLREDESVKKAYLGID